MQSRLLRSDEHCQLDSRVARLIHEVRGRLLNPGAVSHLNHGFGVRHYMLQHCTLWLERECSASLDGPLSVEIAIEAALHLNGYYLNLRGALDNLAWIVQIEFDVLARVSESSRARTSINLFGKPYLERLRKVRPDLHDKVAKHQAWGVELADLRDPAAHRIPLYVPPGVITSRVQLEEFKRLDALSGAPAEQLDGKRRIEIMHEARSVAAFSPIFCVSSASGIDKTYGLVAQVSSDYMTYLQLSNALLSSLAPSDA